MLHIHIDKINNIFSISPYGKLVKAEFIDLSEKIDTYINENDHIPSLLIISESIPHWDSFSTFVQHIKLIKEQQRIIQKVAVVTDSKVLSLFPSFADHFTEAKIRHFSNDNISEAKLWLCIEDDHPGCYEIIEELPSNVVYIRAKGIITAQDYEDILNPYIDEKLKTHDHLNVLYEAGLNFQAFSAGAAWNDTKLGLSHYKNFKRIALVTDVDWLKNSARVFAPFMFGKFKLFDLEHLADAKDWVIH